jgi:small subunit ribosomal protein S2
MSSIDKMLTDGTFDNLSKREKLQITRQRAKLEKNLGSIVDLNRLPAALFVVDVQKEYIAVREAKKLNIPVFAMVDTCCDPTPIDFVIPANDDASKSISLIVDIMSKAIEEGLNERKAEKEKEPTSQDNDDSDVQPKAARTRARKGPKTEKPKAPVAKKQDDENVEAKEADDKKPAEE